MKEKIFLKNEFKHKFNFQHNKNSHYVWKRLPDIIYLPSSKAKRTVISNKLSNPNHGLYDQFEIASNRKEVQP